MISATIRIDRKTLDDIQTAIKDAPANLKPAFEKNSQRIRAQIETEMRKPAGPPQYPIRWASVKQRKAFFASNGFGKGIPTKRSGAYQAGWKVVYRGLGRNDGAVIELENPVPYARYVGGGDAQPFHVDRWPQAVDAVVKYEEALYTTLENSWYEVMGIK